MAFPFGAFHGRKCLIIRWNGIAFFSHTGRAGGLLNYTNYKGGNYMEEPAQKPVQLTDEQKFQLESKRWRNRRHMAWTSLIFLIFVGLWAMFIAKESRLTAIHEILSSIIFANASVVGVYMGLATWAQIGKK
jgi:hypothetical protein